MVKYTHLNRDPGKAMEDLVKKLSASAKGQKTKPTGVKDMGDAGDIVWSVPDTGPDPDPENPVVEKSMRELDITLDGTRADLDQAAQDLATLNEVTLPSMRDELEDLTDTTLPGLQDSLDALNQRVDDIIVDGGGAGNFTTYSPNAPSTAGTGEGDQWFQVVQGEVLGQWRWDGSSWAAVTLTDAVIAGIDLSKLLSNGNLSSAVASKMFADIFTANQVNADQIAANAISAEKIAASAVTANKLAANSVTASKIVSNTITADKIVASSDLSAKVGTFLEINAEQVTGGSFTGETFEGGTFTGGLFETSDALPGQVYFSDYGYKDPGDGATGPGIRVIPGDTSGYATGYTPSIGPNENGMIVSGGRASNGGIGFSIYAPETVQHRYVNGAADSTMAVRQTGVSLSTRTTDTQVATISANQRSALVQSIADDGAKAYMQATTAGAGGVVLYHQNATRTVYSQVEARAGVFRAWAETENGYSVITADSGFLKFTAVSSVNDISLAVNPAVGIMVSGNVNGVYRNYNLLETAQDSGWVNLAVASGFTALSGYGLRYRNKGGVIFFDGVAVPNAAMTGAWQTITTIPVGTRPEKQQLRKAVSSTMDANLRVTDTGALQVYFVSGIATSQVHISPMFHVAN